MGKIYITRRLPDDGLNLLKDHEVEIYEGDAPPSKHEILRGIRGKDALISLLTDTIDADIMDASPRLQIIANYAVGVDNINIQEATRRGILITNTPDVLTETAADLTWALILAIARRLVEGDALMRNHQFTGWAPQLLLGSDVYKKTLGIIGMGKIGGAVARRAQGFHMDILYSNGTRKPSLERELGARYVDLETLLTRSDFVSLHAPLTPETYHLIAERELRLMKKSAYLINTARGKCVDEHALVEALREGWIRGAALDVFEHEPLVTPELVVLPNVLVVPHIGSASYETRSRMAVMAAENVLAAFRGEMPPNCLNPTVGKKGFK